MKQDKNFFELSNLSKIKKNLLLKMFVNMLVNFRQLENMYERSSSRIKVKEQLTGDKALLLVNF